WATMRDLSEECIVFSGDQTSGYEGGSEFFDLNLALFKKKYRDVRYVIFTNNAYSPVPFSECVCRAGYMLRDIEDSGEVYEPKTVESSFTVNCDSTTAYLFGLDLKTNDFVWLNIAENSSRAVACTSDFSYLLPYFRATEIFNMKSLFEMLATEVASTPDEADVIVSDKPDDMRDEKEIVRSCDFERVLQLLN
ncbi:MAG: hypothetical protein IKB23_02360, partial [Clostridia bacterium]|nr:hypothetical protein [Clostridia bacterium]